MGDNEQLEITCGVALLDVWSIEHGLLAIDDELKAVVWLCLLDGIASETLANILKVS